MNWKRLLEPEIQVFLSAHENDDIATLALKKQPQKDWPYVLILDQLKSRQKAKIKIPFWIKADIVLPSPSIIEQASSESAAHYKASLCSGKSFADLTGGAGVDCAALARNFESGFCIEFDQTAAQLLKHNLKQLGLSVEVLHSSAEAFTLTMPDVDLVYLDPQRRDSTRKGKYILKECSPDITALLPVLKNKAKRILLKTSPMLDIHETLETLGCVESVHVVEWEGDCKEVLYHLNPACQTPIPEIPITAVQIDDEGFPTRSFSFTREQEEGAAIEYALPEIYLYEPGPAFQKAGGFAALGESLGLKKLHKHTHLYTSAAKIDNFPGRTFKIFDMLPPDRKLLPVARANLTLRNFPGTTDDLRKSLKLSDGGDVYIFACTTVNDQKTLLLTHKI